MFSTAYCLPVVEEHTGLAGMRERFSTLGGGVILEPRAGGGTRLALTLPLTPGQG